MTSGRFHTDTTGSSDLTVTTTTTSTTSTATTTTVASTSTNSEGILEHIRKFIFKSLPESGDTADDISLQRRILNGNTDDNSRTNLVDKLEIKIPELIQGAYSFYTWPSAPILAVFLWERRHSLKGKRILELGSGTALPGILGAKCGAKVILSDNCILPKSLAHIHKSCLTNNLIPGRDIDIIGLSWGLLLNSVFNLGHLDIIIGSDCFYDPEVFEDIIVTISFLLDRNPGAKFFFTYQERSADWSIEALLKKWKLCAYQINIDDIGKRSGIDILEYMGGHTIHLIEINREQ